MYTVEEQNILSQAEAIIAKRFEREAIDAFTSPDITKQHAQHALAWRADEAFAVYFLDNKHRVIKFEVLFKGTIDSASVYPRVIVRRALELNAAALILAHNHPSGYTTPSQSDLLITTRIKEACQSLDIRVLDHIIVGDGEATSLAERGAM